MEFPETRFKKKALHDLRSLENVWVVKIQQVVLRGHPDLIGCVNGKFFAIELKKDKKEKPEPLQELNLHLISEAGGYSFVAHPDNWDQVFKKIIKLTGAKIAKRKLCETKSKANRISNPK